MLTENSVKVYFATLFGICKVKEGKDSLNYQAIQEKSKQW